MNRLSVLASAAFLALAAAGCSPKTETKVAAQTPGQLTIPPLNFQFRQLPNGLKVYAMPDQTTANVSVQVWYDVGSKDDPAGRSGFAHLFEHLMFKSTANMPAENFDRLTEDVGGSNNASTNPDYTNYYEIVPANHLERVLWAEGERMGSLVVDPENFASERKVVEEELRQSILSSPYGKLFGLYTTLSAFDVHPYGRPTIGTIKDLDAATIDDVRAFHAAYYRPDNAVLVVSGRFDQAQLDGWVDKYLGKVETPKRPIPRVTTVEPARTAPKDLTVYEPNVPLPAIVVSYPSPEAKSPDIAAWMIADAVLSRGQHSRLYESLIYDQKLAAEAGANMDITQNANIYSIYAILSQGKSVDDGLKSLKAEIAKMRDTAVTQTELDEAKNELITSELDQRETADGRSSELAQAAIIFGDPKASDALLAKLQTVTAADVQRVMKSILDDTKSVTIRYLPEEMQNGAKEATFEEARTIVTSKVDIAKADIPTYTLAAEDKRVAPPAPGPAVTVAVPTPSEKTLANGLRVIVVEKHGVPLLSADLRFSAGGASDPAGRAGLASMAADIATRGTTTRSAKQIAAEIESLGAGIGAGAGPDASDISIGGRVDMADKMFAIMADVAQNPAFAPEEIDRAKREALDGLRVSLRQPSSIGGIAMTRAIYGAGPYGNVSSPNSLGAIAQADMKALHDATWRPDNAVLVIAGDIKAADGFALAERTLGSWAKPATPLPAAPDATKGADKPRYIVVDMPKIGQAAVMMGVRGIARTDADFFPLLVANDVLGGGYSARLNEEIRIKRGLSYGANSRISARKAPGALTASAQTRNDAVPQVVDLMGQELANLGAKPIDPKELESRKAVLIGSFGRSVETTSGLAGQLSSLAQFGLPLDKLGTYSADVAAVTADQASAVAKKYYDAAKTSLVVVGDASIFWKGLQGKRPAFEKIDISKLNLDSPTLQ